MPNLPIPLLLVYLLHPPDMFLMLFLLNLLHELLHLELQVLELNPEVSILTVVLL